MLIQQAYTLLKPTGNNLPGREQPGLVGTLNFAGGGTKQRAGAISLPHDDSIKFLNLAISWFLLKTALPASGVTIPETGINEMSYMHWQETIFSTLLPLHQVEPQTAIRRSRET